MFLDIIPIHFLSLLLCLEKARTLEYLKKKSMQPGGNPYADLVNKLHMQNLWLTPI